MKNKTSVRWGIIGCGNVTEVKSGPAYQQTEDFELVAVMRRDEAKAKDYAKRHNVSKYYSDADALINDPGVDAVYIATPPDSHKYYALKVADAGKACCIEKPMAPNYRECVNICDAFSKNKLPLFVAYYRRSLARFTQVKSWLDKGEIGNIRHIEWILCHPPSELDLSGAYNWRTDATIAPGGYFDDLASHGLDLFIYLLGNVKDATGFSVNQQGLYSTKDAVSATWLHKNGITGTGCWNFGAATQEDKVMIYGSKGTLEFSVATEKTLRLIKDGKEKELFIKNPDTIQLPHVQNIRDHLLGGKEHVSTGVSATHTSWVMDKILQNI
jgi:predicted dehydrogenase